MITNLSNKYKQSIFHKLMLLMNNPNMKKRCSLMKWITKLRLNFGPKLKEETSTVLLLGDHLNLKWLMPWLKRNQKRNPKRYPLGKPNQNLNFGPKSKNVNLIKISLGNQLNLLCLISLHVTINQTSSTKISRILRLIMI